MLNILCDGKSFQTMFYFSCVVTSFLATSLAMTASAEIDKKFSAALDSYFYFESYSYNPGLLGFATFNPTY